MLTSSTISLLEAPNAEAIAGSKGQALPQGAKFSELFATIYNETNQTASGVEDLDVLGSQIMVSGFSGSQGRVNSVTDFSPPGFDASEISLIAEQGLPGQQGLSKGFAAVDELGDVIAEPNRPGLVKLSKLITEVPQTIEKDKTADVGVMHLIESALTPKASDSQLLDTTSIEAKSINGYEHSSNPMTLHSMSKAVSENGANVSLFDRYRDVDNIETDVVLADASMVEQVVDNIVQSTKTNDLVTMGVNSAMIESRLVANTSVSAEVTNSVENFIETDSVLAEAAQLFNAEELAEATPLFNVVEVDEAVNTVALAETLHAVDAMASVVSAQPVIATTITEDVNSEVVQSSILAKGAEVAADAVQQSVNKQTNAQSSNAVTQSTTQTAVLSGGSINSAANSGLTQWGAANSESSQQGASAAQSGQTSSQGNGAQQSFTAQQQMVQQFQENKRIQSQAIEQQMAVKAVDELASKVDSKEGLLGGELSFGDRRSQLPVGLQTLSVPVKSPQWGQALGQRVVFMANNNLQQAKIILNPENLGPVQVKLHMDKEQQLHVTMTAQHLTTREAMENALPRLKEMLEQSGVDLASVNVGDEKQFAEEDSSGEKSQALNSQNNETEAESVETTEQVSVVASDNIVDFYA